MGKQERIVLERSARLNLAPGRGDGGDNDDRKEGATGVRRATDSSGENKQVCGFSHTCMENAKHLQ